MSLIKMGMRNIFRFKRRTFITLSAVSLGLALLIIGGGYHGKSTLLHVLGTLDLPTSGAILFEGRDITGLSPARLDEFRGHEIGFVFQFHHLLPELTRQQEIELHKEGIEVYTTSALTGNEVEDSFKRLASQLV